MIWTIKPEFTMGNIITMLVIASSFILWATGLEQRLAVTDSNTNIRIQNIEKQMIVRAATQDKIIDRLAEDLRYLARKGGKKD